MRGEQLSAAPRPPRVRGSPPLARGTVCGRGECGQMDGITPACAGNSGNTAKTIRAARDHPRLRGEQLILHQAHYRESGSPPLARGTVTEKHFVYKASRDHPRLRGEQYKILTVQRNRLGSPPLARGTVRYAVLGRVQGGITPACAGNRRPSPCPCAR